MFWKRSAHALAASILLLTLVSCHGFFTNPVLTSIKVNPAGSIVAVGATQQFTVTGVNDDGSTSDVKDVTWASSSTDIATIDSSGLATGVAKGTATIKATSGTLSSSANLTVTTASVQSITVTSANPLNVVNSGSTLQLTANARLSDGTTQDVSGMATWQTSSPNVATVSNTGLVSGVTTGTVTITASLQNNVQGQITLTVM